MMDIEMNGRWIYFPLLDQGWMISINDPDDLASAPLNDFLI